MNYFLTEKFTSAPKQMAKPEYLTEIFELDSNESIGTCELPQYNAMLYFAETAAKQTPLIYVLLEQLGKIKEHNKLAVSYSKEKERVYITAAQGDMLLLANSYKVTDFTTAFYYISLVTQQAMFNPHLTQINVLGELAKYEKILLNTYYKGIEYCQL